MRELTLADGLTVFSLNADETRFVHREVFVDRCYLQRGIELPDQACVFDVGANIGLATLFFHRERPGLRIFAFEPSPAACECLRANVELHGVNARVFECGLSKRSGTAEFTYYPANSVRSGFHADLEGDRASTRTYMLNSGFAPRYADLLLERKFKKVTFPCDLRTISDTIDQERVEQIGLLKIDVEKSETEVLEGIREEHWPLVDQVVIEVDDHDGTLFQIEALLRKHGFQVTTDQDALLKNTPLYSVYASRLA